MNNQIKKILVSFIITLGLVLGLSTSFGEAAQMPKADPNNKPSMSTDSNKDDGDKDDGDEDEMDNEEDIDDSDSDEDDNEDN